LSSNEDFQTARQGNCSRYDDLVVLVDFVQGVKGVQVLPIPVRARLDFITNEPFRARDSLLYGVELGSVRYEILPFFVKGEKQVLAPSTASRAARCGQVVESGSEVMDDIADDERETVWNWLRGADNQPIVPTIVIRNDFVEVCGAKGGDCGLQLVNVLIGPLNL